MADRLTILFTNIWLNGYAGSEVVVRDVAIGSLRRGHHPIVYTPSMGDFAQELTRRGVAVIDDLRMLSEAPDIIHAHHVIPCAEALIRFPGVPAINVCHAFEHWVEAPAKFPQVGAYVAVDEACRDRLVHTEGVDPARVLVLRNAVDLARVPPRKRPLPDRPRRALAFGKASAAPQIRSACEALSIELEAAGYAVDRVISNPEEALVGFDLVFASARAALEALCCGCAVVVCDARGIAGLVTSANFSTLRERNFGLRSLVEPTTVERLIEHIRRYDRDDASKVCRLARREADLETLLDAFDKLYAEVLTGPRRPSVPDGTHEAAVAQFLHDYLPRRPADPRWPWLGQQAALRERILSLESRLSALENQVADGARQLKHSQAETKATMAVLEETKKQHADARSQLAYTTKALASTTQELAMIKRSRLLKLGRLLRRIRGAPIPY